MNEREQALERIEVEVSSREERERRERAQQRQEIERDSQIDWRSYERRSIPNRWRA
jgi:hypothetical protein